MAIFTLAPRDLPTKVPCALPVSGETFPLKCPVGETASSPVTSFPSF